MDTPPADKKEIPSRSPVRSFTDAHWGYNKKSEVKKKLTMMEAAMPAVLAWNMFQMCQSDGISPAAAARKIFQMDMKADPEGDEQLDESSQAVLQKLDDLIHYQRKLRFEYEKAEELSEFRDRQLRKKVLELEVRAARNRKLFDEMISDLTLRDVDSTNDVSLESVSSQDLLAFEEMQRLAENEIVLRRRIDELEKKESIYLRTLEQADELWTALKAKVM